VPLLFFEIPKLWSPLVFFPAGFFMPFFLYDIPIPAQTAAVRRSNLNNQATHEQIKSLAMDETQGKKQDSAPVLLAICAEYFG